MKEHKRTPSQDLEARAELFKALGHPARLLIVNLIRNRPRHVEELAVILQLSPATVSHHLSRLSSAGLLRAEKDQYYQTYSLAGDAWGQTLDELIVMPQAGLSAQVEEDSYRQKVLATFLRHGRLTGIPAQLKKREILFQKLAEEFEPGRTYSEREVNQVLVEFHDDVATLRRGLIEHMMMKRDGGIYWRAAPGGSDVPEPGGEQPARETASRS
ncbi:MAG: metalloregulator ArsR/SmtB family transcription factor [Anaerolineae bacterium]|nr:metalloregulator ArsR/SmtB family transcription factor [Anaerolineae bacterium]